MNQRMNFFLKIISSALVCSFPLLATLDIIGLIEVNDISIGEVDLGALSWMLALESFGFILMRFAFQQDDEESPVIEDHLIEK